MPLRFKFSIILLAGGSSTRMRGRDKLLEKAGNHSILRTVAEVCCHSQASEVIAVLPLDREGRIEALAGLPIKINRTPKTTEGMAGSIRAGLAGASETIEAAIIVLADMPDVHPDDIDRLAAGYDPLSGITICRAASANGVPGHPVLFGRQHFADLMDLTGDTGARDILKRHRSSVRLVTTWEDSALTDIDTPEDLAAYRARK